MIAVVSVRVEGLEKIVQDLQKRAKTTEWKLTELCNKLADIGVSFMRSGFRTAFYDGTNDAVVGSPNWVSENVLEIPVTGSTVAFIEFGTGVVFADNHPKAADLGAVRGEYGKKRGKNTQWKYYGDPGSFGWYATGKEEERGLVTTHGNPANMPMYHAGEQMRMRITEIAKEVFRYD